MIPHRQLKLINECAAASLKAYSSDIDSPWLFISDSWTDAQAFVYSNSDGNIVITGQGTTSLRDWSLDFQIWRTKVDFLNNTKVHAGFLRQYNAVRDRIHIEVKRLLDNSTPSCRIICTGHSLFGAIASIAAVDCSLLYDVPVDCITFGSPRVGSRAFVKLFNTSVDTSFRCVHLKDPVTFSPLPVRFKHVRGGVRIDNNTIDKNKLSLYNCLGCRVTDHDMNVYAACILHIFQNSVALKVKM